MPLESRLSIGGIMPRRLTTPNDGANAERTAILRKVRRDLESAIECGGVAEGYLRVTLIPWLLKRDERNAKRNGGLGRR